MDRSTQWPMVPRLAADDPARRIMAANLAAEHNRQTQPWHAMGRTLRHQQAWRVYEAICTHVNEAAECWPPRERLAALTSMAESHVSRATRRLKALGYVEVVEPGRRGRATVVFLPDVRAAVIRHHDADDARLRIHSQPFEVWWDRGIQTHAEPLSTPVDSPTGTPLQRELVPQSHRGESQRVNPMGELLKDSDVGAGAREANPYPNSRGANFCSGCGHAFPPTGVVEECALCGLGREVLVLGL